MEGIGRNGMMLLIEQLLVMNHTNSEYSNAGFG